MSLNLTCAKHWAQNTLSILSQNINSSPYKNMFEIFWRNNYILKRKKNGYTLDLDVDYLKGSISKEFQWPWMYISLWDI